MTQELLNCAFCGGSAKIEDHTPEHTVAVECVSETCGADGPWRGTVAEAIAAWNRRVPSPSIREAVEWQPIETAPKDGTRILLMAVRSKRLKLIPEIRWVKLASWRPHHHDGYEEAWREDAVACPGDMSRLQLVPSHWLPLPSPPSPAGESDK